MRSANSGRSSRSARSVDQRRHRQRLLVVGDHAVDEGDVGVGVAGRRRARRPRRGSAPGSSRQGRRAGRPAPCSRRRRRRSSSRRRPTAPRCEARAIARARAAIDGQSVVARVVLGCGAYGSPRPEVNRDTQHPVQHSSFAEVARRRRRGGARRGAVRRRDAGAGDRVRPVPPTIRASASRPATSRGARRAATSTCSTTTHGSRRSTPRPATSASSTPTSRSPATTRSSAASTASRSTTSPTRRTRRCDRRSCAPAGRATCRCTATCCSCRSRRPAAGSTAAPRVHPGAVNPERFRGVRIFDISDIDNPVQLPGVQTCRGSHTHTIVSDPDDPDNIYIYNSGTAGVRSPLELAGCENAALTQTPVTTGNPTQWRIDVIKVPLAAPETAAIVSQPRIFTDPATGAFNGLQNTLPGALHPSGHRLLPAAEHQHLPRHHGLPRDRSRRRRLPGQRHPARHHRPGEPGAPRRRVRPELLLLALGDAQQRRHQGRSSPTSGAAARAPAAGSTDQPEWGADAIFDIVDGQMEFASYYKMPAVQTSRRRTASPTTPRWSRCRAATSSSRRGTRAASR